jgi:cell division protease FtsH
MDVKRLTRGPWIWLIVAIAFVILATKLLSPASYVEVDTSQAIQLITDGKVDSARLVNGDQRIELSLKTPEQIAGKGKVDKVAAYYVDPRGTQIVDLLNQFKPAHGFNDDNPKPSWWGSLIITLFPILLILGLFWFLMGQMQGGGST